MGTLVFVKEPPKGFHWKIEIDGRKFDTEDELLQFARTVLRGNASWTKTNFSGRGSARGGIHSSRKKHFTDGYWMYTFWFTRKADAALFKLMSV